MTPSGRLQRALAAWREARTRPLTWVLLALLAMRLVGITWGLPNSDAWEDDGIAPRDFLVGTVETYTPGSYFTYPPVHLVGLTLFTSPVWGWALTHARSLAPPDVIAAMIQVPVGTALTLMARLVSAVMSVGIVWCLAKVAEELRGPRAALVVAITVGLNVPLLYYGHTSNLDVPYLFWSCLALLASVRAMARLEPRRLRRAFLFAALAVGTKDQAYAIFLLGLPLALGLWLASDTRLAGRRKEVVREILLSAAGSVLLLLLIDGAITNPSGFRQRVAFLLGPASGAHANYPATWAGRWAILAALRDGIDRFYPWVFGPLALAGLAVETRRAHRQGQLGPSLLPLLAAVSFIVCFNFTARRTEHRFALPEMLVLGMYAGLAIDAGLGWRTRVALVLVVPLVGWQLFQCACMDAMFLLDPRYEAEAWLREHVQPGEVVEVYGSNAYLPRLPPQASATRVDVAPLTRRNPLPGMTEVEGRFSEVESRKPRYIVVPGAWVWKYLYGPTPQGQVRAPQHAEWQSDNDSHEYFLALYQERLTYRRAHLAGWPHTFWPRIIIHQSTGHDIVIFERK